MSHDKELEIRRQFLDEAQEYLDTLDSIVLEFASNRIDIQRINAGLRAAHSIKGGAAMMGFQLLSNLAHRLEDSFKVFKTQKSLEIDAHLENLLLSALSCLRHVIICDRQNITIEAAWVETEVEPILQQLYDRLGDPDAEDANSVLATEDGQDILPVLFETEVEGCLQRLESVLEDPAQPCLQEELSILAQELGGLGEMLQLEAFSQLCESVMRSLEAEVDSVETIARTALKAWRRSQALVLARQLDLLPTAIAGAPTALEMPDTASESLEGIWSEDFAAMLDAQNTDELWANPDLVAAEFAAEEFATENLAAEEFTNTEFAVEEFAAEEFTTTELATENFVTENFTSEEFVNAEFATENFAVEEFANADFAALGFAAEEFATENFAVEESLNADFTTENLTTEEFANTAANTDFASDFTTEDFATASVLQELVAPDSPVDEEIEWALATTSEPVVEVPEQPYVPATPVQPTAKQRRAPRESQVSDFKVLEVKADSNASIPIAEDEDATVRVSVRQLNHLNDLFGELTIERNGLELYLKRLRNLTRTLTRRVRLLDRSNAQMRAAYDRVTLEAVGGMKLPIVDLGTGSSGRDAPQSYLKNSVSNPLHTPKAESALTNRFDVLEMDQYNDLHLLSQQVMETIVQVQEVTSDIELSLEDTEQTTRDLNKTAKQLQTSLTQIRMRPLSDIVDRFPRALRELSLQYGKQVKLNVVGGGTLIDRNILEALQDPLMHLLRNAFDHGLEDPETRRAYGKPEQGTIEIRATHRNNRTLITLSDDGRGIPLDKIRAKAERMGLDATLLAAASDEELLSLIFEPGFSTSDQVTALSGRGVGMDVVRDSLRQIRGEITVNTEAGVGTTFTLSVPFTLSVVQVLLVESNGMLMGFPTDTIEEMMLLDPEAVITTAGSHVLDWQGTLVQLITLSQWLKFSCLRPPIALETAPAIAAPTVLMVNQGSQLLGLQVDCCWGEQEVAVRRVEGNLTMPAGFSSCAILGDGRVVPIVNVSELLHWIASCERSLGMDASAPLLPSATPSEAPGPESGAPINQRMSHKANILIVDDSINVRRFLAMTLERVGYQVEQAKDGQDALEKLQRGLFTQLVICDIEMPRLDGYGFLAKVKANANLEPIPVLMLTSRSGDKHRQLAMSLGAAAYFSKPYNEQALLRTLEQLLESVAVV